MLRNKLDKKQVKTEKEQSISLNKNKLSDNGLSQDNNLILKSKSEDDNDNNKRIKETTGNILEKIENREENNKSSKEREKDLDIFEEKKEENFALPTVFLCIYLGIFR